MSQSRRDGDHVAGERRGERLQVGDRADLVVVPHQALGEEEAAHELLVVARRAQQDGRDLAQTDLERRFHDQRIVFLDGAARAETPCRRPGHGARRDWVR